jgi:hypothetical protein
MPLDVNATVEAYEETLAFWCKKNDFGIPPRFRQLFNDEPVSYIVTFENNGDIATLHPTGKFSDKANEAVLEIFKKGPLFSRPPTDLPYHRGLLIRFGSGLMPSPPPC